MNYFKHIFCALVLCLIGGVTCAQQFSVEELNKIYELGSADQINAYFRKNKWEGNTSVVTDSSFDLSWQFNGIEDIMVRQNASGYRYISYRLHNKSEIERYMAKEDNFRNFEKLPSHNKNVSIYRSDNVLQQLTMNRTKGILTILFEERKDTKFWNDLIDKNTKTDPYEVGAYLPKEGGIFIGKSADGKLGYVVAMQDCKHGNGCSWSAVSKIVPNTFTSTMWKQAFLDMNGYENSKSVFWFVQTNHEVQKRAVELACEYTGAGKSDWYLPSVGQLKMMAENKADIDEALRANNGVPIANTWYWSSSQYSDRMAWAYDFKNLVVGQSAKDGHDRVRPVRTIKIE